MESVSYQEGLSDSLPAEKKHNCILSFLQSHIHACCPQHNEATSRGFPQTDHNKPAQGFSAFLICYGCLHRNQACHFLSACSYGCHFLSAICPGVCAEPQHNNEMNDMIIRLHGKLLVGLVIRTKLLERASSGN